MKRKYPTPAKKSSAKKAHAQPPASQAPHISPAPDPAERVITARSVDARLQLYHEFFVEQRKNRNPKALYASYERLAEKIGTSVSTVRRDVQHLRDTRRWPLDFIPERQGWGYTEDVTALPGSHFTEGELTAICLAMRALEGIQRIAFHGKVREAVKKIIEALRAEVKVDLPALEKAVSFRTIGLDAFVDPRSFELVMEAILNREELDIDYAKLNWADESPSASPSSYCCEPPLAPSGQPLAGCLAPLGSSPSLAAPASKVPHVAPDVNPPRGAKREKPTNHKSQLCSRPPAHPCGLPSAGCDAPRRSNHAPVPTPLSAPERVEHRRVEPLHLLCMDQVWYLFAYDPMRADIRSFALTRMRDVCRSGRQFEERPFDLDEHLAPSFGITSGEPVDVTVRFRGKPARLVCERLWHPSQELIHNPDGTVDIHLHVADTPELHRWVLGWGASAEVIEPSDLRDAVRKAAEGILAQK